MKKNRYVLVLGSNAGDPLANLEKSIEHIRSQGISVLGATEVLHTRPIIVPHQNMFVNQGITIETELAPEELLALCKECERELGRRERFRYGPREIDIDIAWWSDGIYQSDLLQIPHRGARNRHWVRKFLCELLPEEKDPESGENYCNMNVKPIHRVTDFIRKKEAGEKITMLTVYDYTMAKLLARTSLDTVLVGDSLGNVIQGNQNTLPVTVDEMIYHASAVRRAMSDIFLTVDMPFMSYQESEEQGLRNAGRLMKETGANAVKLEGAGRFISLVEKIVESGIPVMGHLGLQPQSFHTLGGYRLQGKTEEAQEKLIEDAKALERAGAFAIVLEMVKSETAEQVSRALHIPVIGIGAGAGTDGQVLVFSDYLGLDPDFKPGFVRHFENLSEKIIQATEGYCREVREGTFPGENESP